MRLHLSLLASLALTISWVTSPASATEYVTLTTPVGEGLLYSGPITLEAGDTATVAFWGQNVEHLVEGILEVAVQGQTYRLTRPGTGDNFSNPIIAGPAVISLRKGMANVTVLTIATLAVTRGGSPTQSTPANAAVIPEDGTGQFQVILESSTDLITWTAAMPGSYGGAITKRFFRTRIVKTS